MWDPQWVLEVVAAALGKEEQSLRLEQAPHGLDSWQELRFHPLIAAALREAGLGVFAEAPYPPTAEQIAKPALLRRERPRCDLVLTADPGLPPLDPAMEAKRVREAAGLLFEAQAAAERPRGTPAAEAFWLEVKVTGQFVYVDKVPRPNRAYTSELLATAAIDIPKLAGNPSIRHGGLLIVLFTDRRETAEHDLEVFTRLALERELPVETPVSAGVPILDRVGNGWCEVALVGRAGGGEGQRDDGGKWPRIAAAGAVSRGGRRLASLPLINAVATLTA